MRPALADTDPPFMKFRKWYSQFYAHGTVSGQDVWAPAPPPAGEQPVFVRSTDSTASAQVPRERVTNPSSLLYSEGPGSRIP